MQHPPESLEAGAVVLRRWRAGDVDDLLLALLESWQHLRPWLPWALERPTQASAQAFLDLAETNWTARTSFEFGIRDPGTGTVLGACGLMRRIGPGGLEIGSWVHVDHTGNGIATAAARALTVAGLAIEGTTFIEIHCDSGNVASAGVPARLGYRLVETVDQPVTAPAHTGRGLVWRLDSVPLA
jgi:RimJ/RimL family protein N-acetyltransferase